MIELFNVDCMEYMKGCEDNAFELAIVDPPYGITNKTPRGAQRSPHLYAKRSELWDERPQISYFLELQRVSKNQIIWGGNHFTDMLAPTQSWIFWYKHQPVNNYSKGELAWNSFDEPLQYYSLMYYGPHNSDKNRTHPTQKPVKLYEWLLMNYSKEGDKILDTHLGSGSIAIACHNLGYDLTACELDKEYYEAAIKRINQHKAQLRLL